MALNPFVRRGNPHALVVGMTGVKLGDRLLQIGCADGGPLAAVAAKVGLSGRAVVLVSDDASARRAERGAADQGVLVEVERASGPRLPFGDAEFDLVVFDDTADLVGAMRADDRAAWIRDALRVLRPGGRGMIIGTLPPGGLGALFSRAKTGASFAASGGAAEALEADGFRSVRVLAERDGLVFVEGVKARS